MKTWEIDVEMRVRKTLVLGGPETEEATRSIVEMVLSGQMDISHFVKWSSDPTNRPMPVETIIDNDPQIVAVREVPE